MAALIRANRNTYSMTKSVRVSESFHSFLKSHNRDGETMEETLCRLLDKPSPETETRIVSSGVAD